MIRCMIQNIKQDICSIYFAVSIMLILGVCLLSPGIGMLDSNMISRPMIIEELLGHSKTEFAALSEIYNYEGIFLVGINGLLYMIFPLVSMASVNRYCEERTSGFWIQKTVKSGRFPGTISNLISSSLVSLLAVLLGLVLFLVFIVLCLPYQKFEAAAFFSHLLFICLVAILGTLLSISMAALTSNKFYSFVIPSLLFYAENEFLIGSAGETLSQFSIQRLMNPGNKTISFWFIVIISFAMYAVIDKIEKGRCGISV